MSAGREMPRRRAVSLWFLLARLELLGDDRPFEGLDARAQRMAGAGIAGRSLRGLRRSRLGERPPEGEGDAFVGGEREEAGDGVLEVAHVARPGVRLHRLDEPRLDVDGPHPIAIGVLAHERANERLHVLRAFAKRRDANGHDV